MAFGWSGEHSVKRETYFDDGLQQRHDRVGPTGICHNDSDFSTIVTFLPYQTPVFSNAPSIYALMAVPGIWLVVRMATSRHKAAHAYAFVLYSTFLGHASIIAGSSLAIYLAIALIGVEFINLAHGHTQIASIKSVDVLAIILLIWSMVTLTFHAITSFGAFFGALRQLFVICLILVASKLRPQFTKRDFAILMHGLVLGGAVVAVVCLVQDSTSRTLFGIVQPDSKYIRMIELRPTGLQGNPNAASLYLIFGYCAGLMRLSAKWKAEQKIRFGGHLCLVGLIAWAVFLGQSRSAFLGLSMVTILWLSKSLEMKLSITALLLALAGLPLLIFPDTVFELLNTIFAHRDAPTRLGREELWTQAVDVISRSPVFGEPKEAFHYARSNFHNDLLSLAVSAGLPAALLFLGLLITPLWMLFRARQHHRLPSYAEFAFFTLLAASIHSMFHQVLQGGICFWMIMGLAVNSVLVKRATG